MKNKINTEIILNVGLLLIIFIWVGIEPVWYKWYNKIGFITLYETLNGCFWINIPVSIVLGYLTFLWCCKIWEDRDIRFYRPILCVLGIVILWVNQVEYAKIIWVIDYRWLMTILLVIPLVISIIKCIKHIIKLYVPKKEQNKETNCQIEGFSSDNTLKEIPETLKNYAKLIVDRLLKTDIKEHSYALGVTGEWGVGKTTFLHELEKNFKDRADIVNFNPWMCSSPEQVTKDFFASLQHQLSPKYSKLSNPIKEYSHKIGSLTLSSQPWISLDFLLSTKQESLFEKKNTLSQKFSKLPLPIVVIIDDIDRLERDEVFEVLRLIRNTADLSNMIYLVAYDKEYVTCVLKEKNIKDSSAYLEKIFPIEIHLPKVEEHLIWKTLYNEINTQQSIYKDFTKDLFNHFESDDKKLILKILDNYRRAERFARQFMLNMSYINENEKYEFKWLDVFWLELLQIYDKKSYDVLADDANNELLYCEGNRIKVKAGIIKPTKENEENIFSGEKFWKEETPMILKRLFGESIKTTGQSICYTENYDKFFTLSVSPFRLSRHELKELFDIKSDPNKIIKEWIIAKKYPESIIYQIKRIPVNNLNEQQLNAYVQGLLCFAISIINPYWTYLFIDVKKLLSKDHYSNNLQNIAHNTILDWFAQKKEDNAPTSLLYLSRLLHNLYTTICFDEEGKETTSYILLISNENIENLLVEIIKKYLDTNQTLTALDILNEKSNLSYIFKSCCVNDTYEYYGGVTTYKQLAYNAIIEHFEQKESKPTFEEYEKAYGSLFKRETLSPEDYDDETDYWYDMDEERKNYEDKIFEYFGDNYKKNLDKFKEKCFINEPAKECVSTTTITPNKIQQQGKKRKEKQQQTNKSKRKKTS